MKKYKNFLTKSKILADFENLNISVSGLNNCMNAAISLNPSPSLY